MPLAAAASILPSTPVAPTEPRRLSIEEQVEELAVYSESDDPVGEGDIWYVPPSAEMFGTDGFTFRDLLDIINPLQHIPVVSTAYRAATGDTLDPGARLLGGVLFGGIGGLAAAVVNAVVEQETGNDIGGNIVAALTGDNGNPKTLQAAVPPAPIKATADAAPRRAAPIVPATPAGLPADPLSGAPQSAKPHPARAPISLLPRSAPVDAGSGAITGKVAGAAPPNAVPRLMMDALDKYQAMSRARRGQALAEEI
ncbi:MAG: hypothetical protein OEU46_18035 [Alphaproteobacteria bacterium]|nr:hypothetical protein [Alphaproteobacteria bacterium]